jgi:bifunctional non-homologous end joining protein LigD
MARDVAVEMSNPDKVLFPGDGITKRDLARYYERVADLMLPALRDRPLVLQRYPEGIDGFAFMQKDAGSAPDWIRTVTVPRRRGGTVTHLVADDVDTLVYLANLAAVTLHVFASRAQRLEYPDQMIFDLDPAGDVSVAVDAARALRRVLDGLDVPSFVKLTGSRGLHVHVPLEPTATFDEVGAVARAIADRVVAEHPDELTTTFRKAARGGRLFVDTLRNGYGQHAIAAYSVRARPGAPVATPVDWDEIRPGFDAQRFTMRNIFRRLARKQDPWRGFGDGAVSLSRLRDRLG